MSDTNEESLVQKLDLSSKIESIASIVLAVAVVLTAWAAFQAGKWGGEQSIQFSIAGASRTESTRADTQNGMIAPYDGTAYAPTPGTVSGFLYTRMRPEFLPAMDAWLATDPANNPNAPPTPFVMDEYVVAQFLEAERLVDVADQAAVDARAANQTGDNYVLTAVLFAAVLFFSGIATKLENRWNRHFVNLVGIIGVVTGAVILINLPVML